MLGKHAHATLKPNLNGQPRPQPDLQGRAGFQAEAKPGTEAVCQIFCFAIRLRAAELSQSQEYVTAYTPQGRHNLSQPGWLAVALRAFPCGPCTRVTLAYRMYRACCLRKDPTALNAGTFFVRARRFGRNFLQEGTSGILCGLQRTIIPKCCSALQKNDSNISSG